jgi:hypothetical protein
MPQTVVPTFKALLAFLVGIGFIYAAFQKRPRFRNSPPIRSRAGVVLWRIMFGSVGLLAIINAAYVFIKQLDF